MANGFKVDNAAGAPGINIWSRGPIYPLVIARKERYRRVAVFAGRFGEVEEMRLTYLDGVYWDVLNADDEMSGFASYDDALAAAKGWLEANKPAPAGWGVADAGPVFAYEIYDELSGAWVSIPEADAPKYRRVGFRVRAVEV